MNAAAVLAFSDIAKPAMPLLAAIADELDALARLPVRIGSRDPHQPVEDLSELRHRLRRLVKRLRAAAPREQPAETPAAGGTGAPLRRRRVVLMDRQKAGT